MVSFMRPSLSLPALVQPSGETAKLLASPGLRESQVGNALIARSKQKDHQHLIERCHSRGDLPALRAAVSKAEEFDLLRRAKVTLDAQEQLTQVQKWAITCENAYRKFEIENMSTLVRSVKELNNLSLGPRVWKDKKYPLLKKVKAHVVPHLDNLQILREHYPNARHFAEAWLALVESEELCPELVSKTAKWFRSNSDAADELRDIMHEDDVEVRFIYAGLQFEDQGGATMAVRTRLEEFDIDVDSLTFRHVHSRQHREDLVVAVSGHPQTLGRLRRLNQSGEPVVNGTAARLENDSERQERTNRLLELAGLAEEPEADNAAEEADQDLTPRGAVVVAKKGAKARGTISRAIALKQMQSEREQFRKKQAEDKAQFPRMADDLPSLKRQLVKKYGSLASAWRNGLDLDDSTQVTFNEFCEAMRACNYRGDFKATYKELDRDGSGFITLEEFDPKVHKTLQGFEELLLQKYGSFYEGWKAFDEDGNGFLTESEFVSRCSAIGYRENPRKLFKFLRAKPDARYVTLQDFAPGAFQESLVDPESKSTLTKKEKVALEKQQERDRRMERFDLDALKKLLVSKYGSLAAAWKYGLDIDRNGKITFAEFSRAVRDVGFHGNIKSIWAELNADGSNDISLEELDPDAHAHLESFRRHTLDKHGGYLEAWQALKVNPGTRIHKPQFEEMCEALGYEGNVHELFKHLLAKPAATSFSLTELDPRTLQESHLNPERKSLLSKKEKVEAQKREELAKDKGASDLAAVVRILKNQYGTIPAAWKHALDVDRNGKISFVEFGNAMRRVGFKGKIKELWLQLEKDGNGYITMDELDPKAHRLLTEFKELVFSKFPGWIEAWEFLDIKKNRRLEEHTFIERCEALGYAGDAHQLYLYYLDHPSCDFITLKDIDPVANRETYLDPDRFNTQLKKQEYERAQEERNRQLADKVASDVPSLVRMLVRRFGTITAAWRHSLDLHGNGQISFMEFCRAMQQLCVRGDLRVIWKALDQDGNGQVTLGELDPRAHNVLMDFQSFVHEKFTSVIEAWKMMDTGRKGRLTEADFVEKCSLLGYQGDPHLLFKYLLNKPDANFITLEDLDAQAAYEARQEEREQKEAKSQDMGASDFKSLKELLVRKYGTMPAAWKNCLDPGNNGFVGFVEFCKACRKVGFIGSPRKVWADLEKDQKGRVTLKSFDAEADAALVKFRQLTLARYGNFIDAWSAFDSNKNGWLDEDEFGEVCFEIEYLDDAGQLFNLLLDEPCAAYLTLEDIDPASAHELRLEPSRNETGADKKEMLEQAAREEMARRKIVVNLPDLKLLLRNKFGTMSAAWKHCLDRNGDGQLGYMEFCAALRDIGFKGSVRDLWQQLDNDKNGRITLEEFDGDAHRAMGDFHRLMVETCGSFEEACHVHFKTDKKAQFDKEAFAQGCQSLGYQGDADALFGYLLDKPLENSHRILAEELEPHHLKKRGREKQKALKEKLAKEGFY